MPMIVNTQATAVRDANAIMATAFFPRTKKWIYPRLCGSTISTRPVEPFSITGAAPLLRRFDNVGYMRASGVSSWSFNVPNILFKSIMELERSEMEFDQVGTLIQYAPQMGIRLAETPEYLFASRLLNAHKQTSVTTTFRGQSYTVTMDALPYFSASHDVGNGSVQSNIISGALPATIASIAAQDHAVTAQQLLRDLVLVLNRIKTWVDNQGAPIYPTIDTKDSIVVVVPPCLEPAAALAFKTSGLIAGVSGSSTGSTTNVAQQFVNDVISTGLIAGCPDVENGGTVSPSAETAYYIFIKNDLVKPFYVQYYRPKKGGEFMPPGYDAEGEAKRIIKAVESMGLSKPVDASTLYASSIVEHNLNAVGDNAQESVVKGEKFFISPRYRGNFIYGPWFTGIKVVPSGVSS